MLTLEAEERRVYKMSVIITVPMAVVLALVVGGSALLVMRRWILAVCCQGESLVPQLAGILLVLCLSWEARRPCW